MTTRRQAKKAENKANTKKTTTTKATTVKETPVVEVVEAVKETPVVEPVVTEEPKTEEVKAPAKKATKTTKKEIKTSVYVEYLGKQVEEKDMIAAVKKAWTKTGKKIGDIKSLSLYVKPEEASVYYVINDTETGRVDF